MPRAQRAGCDPPRFEVARAHGLSNTCRMSTGAAANTLVSCFKRTVLLGGLWVGLVGADAEGLVAGALTVPVAVWLSLRLFPPVRPLHLLRLARLLPGFLWRSVIGGVDVAWRAFHPRMPLRPGWISVPVSLPDGGRVALGTEVSLMPGTLSAGAHRGRLLIHVLDTGAPVEQAVRLDEARLAGVLADAELAQR